MNLSKTKKEDFVDVKIFPTEKIWKEIKENVNL